LAWRKGHSSGAHIVEVSRDLKFRDVVHFVVASRLLDTSESGSIQADLKPVIRARIPSSL